MSEATLDRAEQARVRSQWNSLESGQTYWFKSVPGRLEDAVRGGLRFMRGKDGKVIKRLMPSGIYYCMERDDGHE